MKKIFGVILLISLLMGLMSNAALAEDIVPVYDNIKIVIDGKPFIAKDAVGNTVEPFIYNGSTYLPVRAIGEAFNIEIDWDAATKTVFIGKKGGNPTLGDRIQIYIDGVKFEPRDASGKTVAPVFLNGTTYLPVRAIGQAFGKDVLWDPSTKTVSLITQLPSDIESGKMYKITLRNTNNALSVANMLKTNDASIAISEFAGRNDQIWMLFRAADGSYEIINKNSKKDIDIPGQSYEKGKTLIQNDFSGNKSQRWIIKKTSDGAYIICSALTNLYLTAQNTLVGQDEFTASEKQLWDIRYIEEAESMNIAHYRIKSATSDKVLAPKTADNGAQVALTDWTGDDMQIWFGREISGGYMKFINKATGKCFDVSGNNRNEGSNIICWDPNSGDNQKFLVKASSQGYVSIIAKHSEMAVTLRDDGTCCQSAAKDTPQQRWILEKVE